MEYRNGELEIRVTAYLFDPSKVADIERLSLRDRNAKRDIEYCEKAIQKLKEYRLELATRAQELTTMESHIRVTLKREKRYGDKVYYFLTKEKVFSDGTAEVIENQKYTGKERYKAIKAFIDHQKKFPQWEYIKDIEKGIWE